MLKLAFIFFIIIYFLWRLIPWILRIYIKRALKKSQQQYQPKQEPKNKEKNTKVKPSSDDLGEYIDYEEID